MDNNEQEIQDTQQVEEEQELIVNRLEELKHKAKLIGLRFHPSIKEEALKTKIEEYQKELDKKKAREEKKQAKLAQTKPQPTVTPIRRQVTKAERLRREATRLVRCRITCMNPNKREWEGEIVCVKNRFIGSVKKYIPFNAEDGWHIPYVLYTFLRDRKCQVFYNVKGPNGEQYKKAKLVNEFSIELLPPLTPKELKELAQRQAMAAGEAQHAS